MYNYCFSLDFTRNKLVTSQYGLPILGAQMLTVVPTGARNVHIRKVEPSQNLIGLGLPDNKTMYFNSMEE